MKLQKSCVYRAKVNNNSRKIRLKVSLEIEKCTCRTDKKRITNVKNLSKCRASRTFYKAKVAFSRKKFTKSVLRKSHNQTAKATKAKPF